MTNKDWTKENLLENAAIVAPNHFRVLALSDLSAERRTWLLYLGLEELFRMAILLLYGSHWRAVKTGDKIGAGSYEFTLGSRKSKYAIPVAIFPAYLFL